MTDGPKMSRATREAIARAIAGLEADSGGADISLSGDSPQPLVEAKIATLRELFHRFVAPMPFKPGDLVKPRKGFGYTTGDVGVILELADPPHQTFTGDPTANSYGRRLNMRIASFFNGTISQHWVESAEFEAYQEGEPK